MTLFCSRHGMLPCSFVSPALPSRWSLLRATFFHDLLLAHQSPPLAKNMIIFGCLFSKFHKSLTTYYTFLMGKTGPWTPIFVIYLMNEKHLSIPRCLSKISFLIETRLLNCLFFLSWSSSLLARLGFMTFAPFRHLFEWCWVLFRSATIQFLIHLLVLFWFDKRNWHPTINICLRKKNKCESKTDPSQFPPLFLTYGAIVELGMPSVRCYCRNWDPVKQLPRWTRLLVLVLFNRCTWSAPQECQSFSTKL